MVVAYRLGWLTSFVLGRLGMMKAPFFAQPNLLAGRKVVPEFFGSAVTPERLGTELRRGASERAAAAVLALVEERQ